MIPTYLGYKLTSEKSNFENKPEILESKFHFGFFSLVVV